MSIWRMWSSVKSQWVAMTTRESEQAQTALRRMPELAWSTAAPFVEPMMPNFEAP